MSKAKKPIDFDNKITEFCSFYEKNLKFLTSASEIFRTLISALLVENLQIDSITSRIKDRDECISKFKRKYLAEVEAKGDDFEIKDFITDLIGIRVVCLYLEDVEKIKILMEENFHEIDITDKSLLLDNTEDKFGYKGLHLDLTLNGKRTTLPEYKKFHNVRFELQIRTIIQDAWSVLDHKIKYKKNISVELKRAINRLAAQFEGADNEFLRIKKETIAEQEKAVEELNRKGNKLEHVLDAFQFSSISQRHFPSYYFIDYKIDGFIDEILKIDTTFSAISLLTALEIYQEEVNNYSFESIAKMNPYTIIRHCIYLLDKKKYENILYEGQRVAYEMWKSSK